MKTGLSRMGFSVLIFVATTITGYSQTLTTLANFEGGNGNIPYAGALVQGTDGNFYGTTVFGGSGDCGTVFRITARGQIKTLHSFVSTDGCAPLAGLIQGTDGNFYGTTEGGGAFFYGTVFRVTLQGQLTTLYNFNSLDGHYPYGRLLEGADGYFYGTTGNGGNQNYGTVFKVSRSGAFTTLHSFDLADGAYPEAGLSQGIDGDFYGTTGGGATGQGTAFRINSGGKLTTIHKFCSESGCADGGIPQGELMQSIDGNLYGTAYEGGAYGDGVVFKIGKGATLTTLHSFDLTDGDQPTAGLILGTDGNLYGTTAVGGALSCNPPLGCGTVFNITPTGTLATLHTFDSTDGSFAFGSLLQSTDGNFYGTAEEGGDLTCSPPNGCGTVFNLDMGLGPFVAFVRAYGKVGQMGGILGQGFTGTTSVSFNGIPANFAVVSDTFLRAAVPSGATTGYVIVITPGGTLTSNVPFQVIH